MESPFSQGVPREATAGALAEPRPSEPLPFSLNPKVVWVKGPVQGALYDLRTGRVIPVPPPFVPIVEALKHAPQVLPRSPFFSELVLEGILLPGKEGAGEVAPPREIPDPTPRLLWLELTGQCNYTCIHCYAQSSPRGDPPGLSPERFRELIAEGRSLGFTAIQFTGGDPFLHPNLMEFVALAHALNYPYVEVYTNGSLCTPAQLQCFAQWGTRLALSFYSHKPETYAAITGNREGYSRVLRTLEGLITLHIPFRIGIILMEENREELAETVAFLKGLGVPEESIATDEVRPAGRGMELLGTGCSSPPRQASAFVPLKRIRHEPQRHLPVMRPPRTFSLREGALTYNTCWNGEIVVDPQGEVYPCIFARTLSLGNVRERSLKEIVEGEGVQRSWSLTLGSSRTCSACEYRYACFDCRALTLNLSGDLHGKPPSCFYDPFRGVMEGTLWLRRTGRFEEFLKGRLHFPSGRVEEEGEGAWLSGEEGIFWLSPLALTLWELSPHRSLGEIALLISALRREPEEEWQERVADEAFALLLAGAGEMPGFSF